MRTKAVYVPLDCRISIVGGIIKIPQELPYYIYILLCKDGSYYTGHAKDVERRLETHRTGRGARYTRIHEPEKLVYVEKFDSRGEAMKRERHIKRLSHTQKQQLITNYDKSN